MKIDVDRLAVLIEDAAIRYAGCSPVDFRPTAKEIAALVLEEAAKVCDEKYNTHAANGFPREASTARALAAAIRALAKGVE
ncbi:MAG TPA: hypothetical protein VFM33_10085 [Aquabacterium sp.]|nr:hypothetical protein [Aquabacterium sp.]